MKRHRLPRSRINDGKTLVAVDLDEVRHKPLPARSPRGDHPMTDVVATLKAKDRHVSKPSSRSEQQRSAGHRADYERERERADRMVTTQDRLISELEALRTLLAAAQEAARPITSRTTPSTGMAPVHSAPAERRRWWRWRRSTG